MARLAVSHKEIPSEVNAELKDCYDSYNVLLNLCTSAKRRSIADKTGKFLRDHGIPVTKQKNRQIIIEDYFDSLYKRITDNAFTELIATFEKIVFSRIGNATGLTRKIVRENYIIGNPFHIAISSFIKDSDDINRLSSIHNILQGKIPDELSDSLGEIISYRNRITHGRRFGKETHLTLQNVLEILSKILTIIA